MNKIKEFRENKGLTQLQLGRKIRVHYYRIDRWEKGTLFPTKHHLMRLAEVFECEIEDFYTMGVSFNLYYAILHFLRMSQKWILRSVVVLSMLIVAFYVAFVVFQYSKSFHPTLPTGWVKASLQSEVITIDDVEYNLFDYTATSSKFLSFAYTVESQVIFSLPVEGVYLEEGSGLLAVSEIKVLSYSVEEEDVVMNEPLIVFTTSFEEEIEYFLRISTSFTKGKEVFYYVERINITDFILENEPLDYDKSTFAIFIKEYNRN